ncbi:hypothetical protein GQL56_00370 [Pseudomonas putida]|nr:hypothetical protein [Pseudomonas putida]
MSNRTLQGLVAITRNPNRPAEVKIRAADDVLDMADPEEVRALALPLADEARALHDQLQAELAKR